MATKSKKNKKTRVNAYAHPDSKDQAYRFQQARICTVYELVIKADDLVGEVGRNNQLVYSLLDFISDLDKDSLQLALIDLAVMYNVLVEDFSISDDHPTVKIALEHAHTTAHEVTAEAFGDEIPPVISDLIGKLFGGLVGAVSVVDVPLPEYPAEPGEEGVRTSVTPQDSGEPDPDIAAAEDDLVASEFENPS